MRVALIMVLFGLFGALEVQAQNNGEENNEDSVLLAVEHMPEYPGGMTALVDYLKKNIKYPKNDRKKKREGTIYVEFVVDKDGSIYRVRESKLYNSDGSGEMKKEALRVISEMPNWKAGMQRGKYVKVQYVIPIKFSL